MDKEVVHFKVFTLLLASFSFGVNKWLGLHAFGLYVHNDTLQALSRPASMFSDNAIQLKPIFGIWVQSLRLVSFDIELLDNKIVYQTQELGTADFMVHHIHAFTIHCTLLILLKVYFMHEAHD
jgi:photosystem I P700 chlorophyll a apoprotein A1